jgi:hypothetical protein
MRGRITVNSELNKGTAFVIEIPVNAEYTGKKDNHLGSSYGDLNG